MITLPYVCGLGWATVAADFSCQTTLLFIWKYYCWVVITAQQ